MGILLGGVPGVSKGRVSIIGGGQAGTNAAKIALGLGADVTILDVNPKRLQELEDLFDGRVHTIMSNPLNIEQCVKDSDLVIGAVLIPGAKAPNLVTEDMVKEMRDGAVIVDIAIDQRGILKQRIEFPHMMTQHIKTWCRTLCCCEYAWCSATHIYNCSK